MDADDREYLEQRRDILTQMDVIKTERDKRVRALLADATPVQEIMAATGLTRARIYQIKNQR